MHQLYRILKVALVVSTSNNIFIMEIDKECYAKNFARAPGIPSELGPCTHRKEVKLELHLTLLLLVVLVV